MRYSEPRIARSDDGFFAGTTPRPSQTFITKSIFSIAYDRYRNYLRNIEQKKSLKTNDKIKANYKKMKLPQILYLNIAQTMGDHFRVLNK